MQQYIFANGYRVFGGTTEEWAAHDDPLYYRELGIEYTDDGRVLMKAGIRTEDDSPTPWSKLPYIYGKQGDKGDIGPEGPSPDFEWDGTKIRFKKPDGTWGVWVDLKGPKGDQGDPPEIAGSAYLILDDREYTDEEVRDAVEALDLPDGTICSVWFGDPGTDGGSDGVDGAASCLVDYTRPVNVPLTESEGAYTMDNAGIAPIDGQAVASISMTGSGNLTNRYFYISANDVTIYSGRLATATGVVNAHCFPFTVKKGDTFIVAASKEVPVTYSVRIYPFIDTVYSTSEQVIGTWIDGKPLYRKVVIPNTPTTINVVANTDVSTLNIETVTRMEGYYYWDSSHNVTPMVFNSASVSATLALSNRASLQLMVTAKSWLNATGQIILEYTKTTDAGTVDAASLLSTERVIPEATDLASLASAAEAIASMTKSSLEMSGI